MTAHVELLQEHPDLQKNVTQDVRVSVLVDGVLTSVDTSDVGITVVNAAGTTVTTGGVTLVTTGEFAASVSGALIATETELTITTVVTVSGSPSTFVHYSSVVGSQLFSLYELRNSGASKFTAAKFPDAKVLRARTLVTDFFEEYCNTRFIRRYGSITLDGSGASELLVPVNNIQEVVSVSVDGTAFTAGEVSSVTVYDWGKLYYSGGFGSGYKNVTVGYIAGPPTPPRDIAAAGIEYCKWILSPGNTTDRALILTDETGTYRLNQAGMSDKPTGFPGIDFTLNLHRQPMVW